MKKQKIRRKENKNTAKNLKKNIKGITLIALVVTIIVLLILASVAISLTIGNNGIITRAMQAKEITEMATLEEEANFVKADLEIGSKALNADLTQGILLNAINIKMEGSVLQGNKVITSDEKYAVVVQNDSDLTINVIRYREGILAEGELGLDLEYNKDMMQVYIYPKVGGLQSYADYAKEELAKIESQEQKIDIVVKGICKQYGITEEEFNQELQNQGMTVEEYINYAIQAMGLKDIDELIIVMKFIDGYEEKENIILDITYNNGTVEKISYPEKEYLTEAVSSNSTYNYKVNYGIQQVSKSIDVTVKEKVDQTQIFEYNAETGYITGIKKEYLSETPPKPSKQNKDGISTYILTTMFLTYGYPYLTIPEEIDGTTIVGIDEGAINGICNITVVELPNTIKEIKDNAFWSCDNLEIVNFPNSITKIGLSAFSGTNIKRIYIPNSVEKIGKWSFDVDRNITIDCEVESKPTGWDNEWYGNPKYTNATINWGVKK